MRFPKSIDKQLVEIYGMDKFLVHPVSLV